MEADVPIPRPFTKTSRFVSGETMVVDGAAWMWKPPIAPREAIAALSRNVESKSRAVGQAGNLAKTPGKSKL